MTLGALGAHIYITKVVIISCTMCPNQLAPRLASTSGVRDRHHSRIQCFPSCQDLSEQTNKISVIRQVLVLLHDVGVGGALPRGEVLLMVNGGGGIGYCLEANF